MSIEVGTQLGSHEITALLGKGGMGEVYRARDTRLKREVAIKILPDEFSRDADRISRFQREAELLASLNHPNIAAIYNVEEAEGARYLVLELVEGDTLADKVKRGPIPPAEALQIAKNICEALEAAHEKGVIHRDLKPGNVKVTPDGKVKVLDFGLAKALEASPAAATMSNSPTLTLAGTNPGMILGTAAYMSPEQARGRAADQRSDVFSLGCVLYEMLTGRQAFQGEEVSDVLASVLKSDADFNLLPARLNPRVREVLRRCLEKNPKLRWHAVGDARVEIEAVLADPSGIAIQPQREAEAKPLWRRTIPVAAAVVLTAVITGVSVWNLKPVPPLTITRFPMIPTEGVQIRSSNRKVVAISPDGTQIVYSANRRLYRRLISELEARPIPGTENMNNGDPVFSPDGRSLAFGNPDLTLKKIAVTGGAIVTICSFENFFGISWGVDGVVFAEERKGIMRVSESGGNPELIAGLKGDEEAHWPQLLPGGKHVLFTLGTGQATDRWDTASIVAQSIKTGERKKLIERGSSGRYLPTGHIVYSFGGTLFAVPFDLGRLKVTGGPVPVVEGVQRSTTSGVAQFSVSDTGSLVYLPGPTSIAGEQRLLALQDRKGTIEPLKIPTGSYGYPRISPDGRRVAFESVAGKETNIWIYDLGGTVAPRQLTTGGSDRYPVWSSNGERVAFQSNRDGDLGIFWQRADGAAVAERLTKPDPGVSHIPDSWSPDGQSFSFSAIKGNEAAVWIFSLKDKTATVFAQATSALVRSSAFSPDGHWLAYQSNQTRQNQIWVQPFPNPTGARYPIHNGGQPFWSHDGKELFFNSAPAQYSVVSISTRPSFEFGAAARIAPGVRNASPTTSPRNADTTRDGKLIGVIDADQTQAGTPSGSQIQVVINWFEDVKQRMSVR